MRRIVFGALAGATVLAAAGAASAQYVTYGQPSYGAQAHVSYGQPTVQDYRYAHGGQVAVLETRPGAYAATGAWADGRSGYGYGHGGVGYGGGCHDRCGGYPPPVYGNCGSSCGGYVTPLPPQGCHSPCGGYGQGHGHAGGYAYSQTTHWSERRGHWSRYQAYGRHDRGGRYGYSVEHGGRGYYERDGYHDDRPPAGRDPGRRRHDRGCDCYTILDDR